MVADLAKCTRAFRKVSLSCISQGIPFVHFARFLRAFRKVSCGAFRKVFRGAFRKVFLATGREKNLAVFFAPPTVEIL